MSDIQALTSKVQELAEKHGFWNTWSVRLIAVSLIATALYFFAQWMVNRRGNELSEAQAALIRAKDEQLTADLKEKDAQISEANNKAAEANKEAGRANERAETLEGQNIKLRTDLENATAEARSKDLELTREQQKLTKEQKITANAQREAAQALLSAQFNLQQVRSLLMPRRLVDGQNREKFLEALKDKPSATVDIIWQTDFFTGEPRQFAEDIAAALKESGWIIKDIKGVLIASDPDPLNVQAVGGIRILVHNPDNPSPSEMALQWAFLSSGFVVDFFPNTKPEGDIIKLLIWMVPPDGGRVLQFRPGSNKN